MRFLIILLSLLFIVGCGVNYPELDQNAIAFKTSSYYDLDDDSSYLTIDYNGRTYLPYGTINGIMKKSSIEKCIGYVLQDENTSAVVNLDDKDTRIYTLVDDYDNNFLMEYYIASSLMNQPIFYRAIDTKGKQINIPKYIGSLDYNFWK